MAFKFGARRVMVASLAAKNKSPVNYKLVYIPLRGRIKQTRDTVYALHTAKTMGDDAQGTVNSFDLWYHPVRKLFLDNVL